MAENAVDAKPEVDGEKINLKVVDQESTEVHFKVKVTTTFEKIFNAYCEKKGIDLAATRFMFDGKRLASHQTPRDHEMEDGDVIEKYVHMDGGRL